MKRVVLLLSLATPAFAQDETTEDGRPVRYQQQTQIDFDILKVDGELVKPNFGVINEHRQAAFNPLIRVRADFNDMMNASVGEAK